MAVQLIYNWHDISDYVHNTTGLDCLFECFILLCDENDNIHITDSFTFLSIAILLMKSAASNCILSNCSNLAS